MIALATATRLIMPPERLAGIFSCCPSSPTESKAAEIRVSSSFSSLIPASRRGKATFSPTLKESNKAPCWNMNPMLLRICFLIFSGAPLMRLPSIST